MSDLQKCLLFVFGVLLAFVSIATVNIWFLGGALAVWLVVGLAPDRRTR